MPKKKESIITRYTDKQLKDCFVSLIKMYNASDTIGNAVENIFDECKKSDIALRVIAGCYVKSRVDVAYSFKNRLIGFIRKIIKRG